MKKLFIFIGVFFFLFASFSTAESSVVLNLTKGSQQEVKTRAWIPVKITVGAFQKTGGIIPNVLIKACLECSGGDCGYLYNPTVATNEDGLSEFLYRAPDKIGNTTIYFVVENSNLTMESGCMVEVSYFNYATMEKTRIYPINYYGFSGEKRTTTFFVKKNSVRKIPFAVALGKNILPEQEPIFSDLWGGPLFCNPDNSINVEIGGSAEIGQIFHWISLSNGYFLPFVVETIE
ncbi:MAG: hypothetical protein V1851_02140 [Patescibacteria group bacterium]